MWQVDRLDLDPGTQTWRGLAQAGQGLSFGEVCNAWRTQRAFRDFWIANLRESRFESFCWECPPVCHRNRSRPFECVFVSSPSLARMTPDREAFREHFRPGCPTATFDNLGGDAVLVAPCPLEPDIDYGHLAQFVRDAPDAQQHALWQSVGDALQARMGSRPVWLSTAGHGVAWLHVRLDSAPKYYRHAAYMKV